MTSSLAVPQKNHAKRAAVASGVGTLIEWYDFFIFGTASALVFPALFFPAFDPLTGTLLSFATFAGGFVARPIGAILFGHLGDRTGRRTVLMLTLLIMGIATLLIGFLPTYDSIGVFAPILLVILRLIQGLAVSGEFGGAVLLAIEHAPDEKRGLYGSAPQVSLPIALALSSTVFLLMSTTMSDEQFMTWGWRIPFIASLLAVIIGLWIRISVPETVEFTEVKKRKQISKFPLAETLRDHKRDFWLVVLAYPATGMTYYVLTTFCVTYGVGVGFTRDQMLWVTVISAGIMLVLITFGAAASDRIGRKPVYTAGLLVMGVGAVPLFPLLNTGNIVLAFTGFIIPTIGFGLSWGVLTTFFSDVFGARLRYSAVGTAYTFGTILGSSTAPFIATFILSRTGSVVWVTVYMLAWIAVSLVATAFMRETRKVKKTHVPGKDKTLSSTISNSGPLTGLEVIDLTMPARHGDGRLGQANEFSLPYTYEEHGWQAASFKMFAHFGSHVDAPLHFIKDGASIDEVPLTSLIARGALFDLHDVRPEQAIDRDLLSEKDPGLGAGEIAILRTDWTDKHWAKPEFLSDAPYLTEDAATWLLEKKVKAVVYDFPEERAVRNEGFGGRECVVHHTLLGNGVYNIEYVINLWRLRADREYVIVAMPLKLVSLDGSPARVIALEM